MPATDAQVGLAPPLGPPPLPSLGRGKALPNECSNSSTKGQEDEDGSGSDSDGVDAIRNVSISVDGPVAKTSPGMLSGSGEANSKGNSKGQPAQAKPGHGNAHSSSNGKPSLSSLRSLLGVPPSGMQRTAQNTASSGGAGAGGSSGLLGVPPSTSSLSAPSGIGGASGAQIGGSTNRGTPGVPRSSASSASTPTGSGNVATLPSEIAPRRKKVVLGPGCSALDWARRKQGIAVEQQQRGRTPFSKITPTELKKHKQRDDAWSAFQGKVYDITPYLRFHPGGVDELMRVAGRDGTRLFSACGSERVSR